MWPARAAGRRAAAAGRRCRSGGRPARRAARRSVTGGTSCAKPTEATKPYSVSRRIGGTSQSSRPSCGWELPGPASSSATAGANTARPSVPATPTSSSTPVTNAPTSSGRQRRELPRHQRAHRPGQQPVVPVGNHGAARHRRHMHRSHDRMCLLARFAKCSPCSAFHPARRGARRFRSPRNPPVRGL